MALVSGFYACVNKENETRDNAIDSTLQTSATAILESKLSELNAQSGQVIVMEVKEDINYRNGPQQIFNGKLLGILIMIWVK